MLEWREVARTSVERKSISGVQIIQMMKDTLRNSYEHYNENKYENNK